MYAGVGHGVPVDGVAGAGQVTGARQAYAPAQGQFPVFVLPAGTFGHPVDALGQADTAYLQVIGRQRPRLLDHVETQFGRVNFQPIRDLVELYFLAEAGLNGAVAALRPARGLVGEHPAGIEGIARQVVGDRLQHRRIERAGDTVGTVSAAVQQGLQVHGGQRAVYVHAGAKFHQHRVAAAMAVKYLFAVQADLDGTAQHQRGFDNDDFVVERVGLAAETTAVGRGDDADMGHGQVQGLGHSPVHVVGALGAGPEGYPAFSLRHADCGMLLQGQVGIAFEEKDVLEHVGAVRQALLHVTELVAEAFMDVPLFAVVVQPGGLLFQRLNGVGDGIQRFVLDPDQFQRLFRGELVSGNDRGNGVADETHFFPAQGLFILAYRQYAVFIGKILTGQDQLHAGMAFRPADIDRPDKGMGHVGTQQLAMQHARQHDVVGKAGLPCHLVGAIHAPARFTDYGEGVRSTHPPASPAVCPAEWSRRSMASSTDSKICW